MVRERQTTEAAEKRAEEREVDVQKVESTGGTSGDTVTAQDVEEQAPEIVAEDNRVFRVRLNPALGPNVDGVDVGGKFYKEGTRVSAKEFESIRKAKVGGHQPLLKGAEVT